MTSVYAYGTAHAVVMVGSYGAGGLKPRQIGAELFISHRTVERHVSNILAKLDARTRAELTAIAHRDGLISVG